MYALETRIWLERFRLPAGLEPKTARPALNLLSYYGPLYSLRKKTKAEIRTSSKIPDILKTDFRAFRAHFRKDSLLHTQ